MKITWLGHSAFRIEFGSTIILMDPFLTGNPSFKGTVKAASAGATHILLTHGHDDHIGDSVAIAKATNAQIVANYEICMYLGGQGASNINPGNSGGAVPCGAFETVFTQALHSSGTTVRWQEHLSWQSQWPHHQGCKGERTLYHMGDTDAFGDMAILNELHAPKIGIVPIGDRFTMGAKTAAFAVNRFFNFEDLIPCHYGTFPIIAADADEFVGAMKGSKSKVHVPAPGGSLSL